MQMITIVIHIKHICPRYESLSNQFEQLEGYQYESKIKTVLHGLNFSEEDFNKPINDFSGWPKHTFIFSSNAIK